MKISNTSAPIVFIMGPTASGKTALAMTLYQQRLKPEYEIISVDSAMVFKQMNIGSAKPSEDELALAPHHLIDFVDPASSYSVSEFRQQAIKLINRIHSDGKVPLLVGGTMMYFKALRDGLADMPSTEEGIRLSVKQQVEEKGLEWLHQQLAKVDPKTAKRLHVNDSQRITRAYEVYLMTGSSLSDWHAKQQQQALLNPLLSIALAPQERSVLHQRIAKRFHLMIEQGFVDEVKSLYERKDLDLDCPSMRSVGYRQIWHYLDGSLSLDEAVEKAIIATRQLAKRQYTWLRSWPDVQWYDSLEPLSLSKCANAINEFSASINQ